MYNQMVNQQHLITSPVRQIIKSSRQHVTHTDFFRRGNRSYSSHVLVNKTSYFEMVPFESHHSYSYTSTKATVKCTDS